MEGSRYGDGKAQVQEISCNCGVAPKERVALQPTLARPVVSHDVAAVSKMTDLKPEAKGLVHEEFAASGPNKVCKIMAYLHASLLQ